MATLTIKFDDALDGRIAAAHGVGSLDELQEVISNQLVEQTKDYEVKQTERAEEEKKRLADEESRQVVEAKIAAVQTEVKVSKK
jgi:hypothetical protein